MLLRVVPRLQAAFPGVKIKLRGDNVFSVGVLFVGEAITINDAPRLACGCWSRGAPETFHRELCHRRVVIGRHRPVSTWESRPSVPSRSKVAMRSSCTALLCNRALVDSGCALPIHDAHQLPSILIEFELQLPSLSMIS